ncbi:hypothetical protein [Caulobacter sp. FWC2]|uniref:hypothetical protein n=1 Tax=Caulobacter sp. FWC2 TaxID=69664 RepID=UPI000C14B3DD|nr:hypothetical protein [Caulobacter sp. FWC2]PIB92201.1 hypothetical protein CSW62_11855 [Caulobacter sp. FWC2]
MRRVLLGIGVMTLLASGSAVSARQSDTMMGDARRENGLAVEMARLRSGNGPTGGARQGVCPLVRGASAEVNDYVAARMRQVAKDVGAEYARWDCEPNVVVLFSSEPDQLLNAASRDKRFNYSGVTAQRAQQFKTSTQPVRWMHGSATPGMKTRDARPYNSLVVVDANKAADVKVSALADYVTMVSLADVQARAAPADGTILNLFDNGKAEAMTEADRAYLRAVYRTR